MYLSNELNDIIRSDSLPIDGKLYIDLSKLEDVALFFVKIHNNELSRVMDAIKDIINKNEVTKSFTSSQILQEFMRSLIDGHLDIHIVHCEIILMNQIRSTEDILENPHWEYKNEPYQILTLNQSLLDNPRVVVSLMYQNLSKMLYNPLTYRKNKPSAMDLLFMPKPQEYLNATEIIKTKAQPEKLVNPILKTRK